MIILRSPTRQYLQTRSCRFEYNKKKLHFEHLKHEEYLNCVPQPCAPLKLSQQYLRCSSRSGFKSRQWNVLQFLMKKLLAYKKHVFLWRFMAYFMVYHLIKQLNKIKLK